MSEPRISRDNDHIRKVLWYLKNLSPFGEDRSSIRSTATSIVANEVDKMEGKNVFKYNLKCNEVKTSVRRSSKVEATIVSDLLFQS